jgi:RNA polymerase sigma factor (sigma-70 family)
MFGTRADATGDGVLLERFARHADEAAFATLVRRHGPLVWSVSRRVARHEQDAEDVYQATFLLLARKAGAIRKGNSVASWLYGVAHRLALRVRCDAVRRRQREGSAVAAAPGPVADDLTWRELREALDAELARLPEKYRAPLLLCYFDGLTQEEAARQLGWSRRTVKYRLEGGRDRLRGRLARRGLTLPMALAGPLLAGGGATAAAPAALSEGAVRAALRFARGRPVEPAVTAQVVALAEGGLKAMWVSKLQALTAALLAAVLLGGAALLAGGALPQAASPTASPEKAGGRKVVDRYGDALPRGAVLRLGTVRYRHGGVGTAFLPDSKTVVSIRDGHAIPFWDARTGQLVREIDTGKFSVGQRYAFSRGAKRLAVSGSVDDEKWGWRHLVRVYDTASGKVLRSFDRESRDGASALALSPGGDLLFSLSYTGKLRVEEVATGVELLRQKFPGDVAGTSLAISPDGSTLAVATGANTHKLFLWNWQAAEEPRALKAPRYTGNSLAFSPDGKLLAECGHFEPTVRLWEVPSGRLLRKLELPDHARYRRFRVAFSPDGKALAAAGQNNQTVVIHLWDPATGKFLKRLPVGGALAFSPDGKLLAAGSRVWDLAAGKELSANDQAHSGAVEHILTGPDNLVVTASEDNTIRLWDAATARQRHCLAHDGWVRAVALSPDGTRLVSNSLDDTVCLWDVATGRKIYRLAGHGELGGRRAVVFSPDGQSFLSWGDDMHLRKWDVRTGKAVFEISIRPSGVKVPDEDDEDRPGRIHTPPEGRFTPDGKHLILQSGGKFFIMGASTGKELRHFPSETGYLTGLAISPDSKLLLGSAWGEPVQRKLPDGRMLSTSARDHPVTWWDLTTGKQQKRILLPKEGAGPVAFSPDGKFFAAASSQPLACIRLVEVPTGREVRRIEGFRGAVRSLAFLPDGRRLISGMEDGSALFWNLAP